MLFNRTLRSVLAGLCLATIATTALAADTFHLIVMDPLSQPLSCDCVKGYAQRDYGMLAKYLEAELGVDVNVVWHESFAEALQETDGKFDLVVGKHSVVLFDAKKSKVKVRPIARLTGKDGSVVQQGLIVVRSGDAAKSIQDLADYQLFLGPKEAEEKSSAPLKLLSDSNVEVSDDSKIFGACSEAAVALLKLPEQIKAAAVISSYAEPLLKGCGSIKKGDLRVVAKTPDVPFITAFANSQMPKSERAKLQQALLNVGANAGLLTGLETASGFEPWKKKRKKSKRDKTAKTKASTSSVISTKTNAAWTQFRGPNRDGRVNWLPSMLPDESGIRWESFLPSSGVGGIAATDSVVVVGSRDATDRLDLFQGFDARDGKLLWKHAVPAPGELDYGNSPRATPLIVGPLVYVLGAFGNLSCLDLESGVPLWSKHLVKDFGGERPEWGYSSSPIAIGDNVLVQPGGGDQGLIQLDGVTGEVVWQANCDHAAYASPIIVQVDGNAHVVGLEQDKITAWNLESGESVQVSPGIPGDFGVPSPVSVGNHVFVTSENNGTRKYLLSGVGSLGEPIALHERTSPDSHTPVHVGDQILVVHNGLWSLDAGDLEKNWALKDRGLVGYASLVATDSKALAMNVKAELLLIELNQEGATIVDRMGLTKKSIKSLAHPALVGKNLYAQVGQKLLCIDLGKEFAP